MKFLRLPDASPWQTDLPPAAEFFGVLLPLAALQLPFPGINRLPFGWQVLVSSFLAVVVAAACLYVPLGRRWQEGVGLLRLSRGPVWKLLLILVIGTSVIKYGTEAALTALHLPFAPEQEILTLFKSLSGGEFVAMAFAVIVLVPGCEEVMFRRLLYGWFRRRFPVWSATVLQAVLFGALHGTWIAFPPLVFFGIVQEASYLKTRNIVIPVTAHMLFNALTVLGIFLEATVG